MTLNEVHKYEGYYESASSKALGSHKGQTGARGNL
jgi:hypothetical protein